MWFRNCYRSPFRSLPFISVECCSRIPKWLSGNVSSQITESHIDGRLRTFQSHSHSKSPSVIAASEQLQQTLREKCRRAIYYILKVMLQLHLLSESRQTEGKDKGTEWLKLTAPDLAPHWCWAARLLISQQRAHGNKWRTEQQEQ